MSNRKGSIPSVPPQSSDLARNIHPSANAEHLAKLCQRVDMPLALKLLKVGINYDSTTWKRLRLGGRLHMLSQTLLLARIIRILSGRFPKLGPMYLAILVRDARCFIAGFEQLFLAWETAIIEFDEPLQRMSANHRAA
jgi:hypothetical protein